MRTKDKKHYAGVGLCLLMLALLSGCGQNLMEVTILDGQTETRMEIKSGQTVGEALDRAEIQINEKDKVVPDVSGIITAPDSQIVINRYAKVVVVDGVNITELEMTGQTVQDALNQLDLKINENDYINYSPDAYLSDGMRINLIRRMAVEIDVDGEQIECLTKSKDVEGLLAEQNIHIDKKDRISPDLSEKLKEGSKIKIERVSTKEIVEKEAIDFETIVEYSGSMYTDQSVEKTPGIKGEKEVTYQVIYVDGKEESRKIINEKVLTEPVAQVVMQGTKQRRRIVSRQAVADCDCSGHGYYIITWSDGTVEYQDY